VDERCFGFQGLLWIEDGRSSSYSTSIRSNACSAVSKIFRSHGDHGFTDVANPVYSQETGC